MPAAFLTCPEIDKIKCLFGSHLNAYLMFLDPRLHLFFILLYIYISINIYFYVYMCTD